MATYLDCTNKLIQKSTNADAIQALQQQVKKFEMDSRRHEYAMEKMVQSLKEVLQVRCLHLMYSTLLPSIALRLTVSLLPHHTLHEG